MFDVVRSTARTITFPVVLVVTGNHTTRVTRPFDPAHGFIEKLAKEGLGSTLASMVVLGNAPGDGLLGRVQGYGAITIPTDGARRGESRMLGANGYTSEVFFLQCCNLLLFCQEPVAHVINIDKAELDDGSSAPADALGLCQLGT